MECGIIPEVFAAILCCLLIHSRSTLFGALRNLTRGYLSESRVKHNYAYAIVIAGIVW